MPASPVGASAAAGGPGDGTPPRVLHRAAGSMSSAAHADRHLDEPAAAVNNTRVFFGKSNHKAAWPPTRTVLPHRAKSPLPLVARVWSGERVVRVRGARGRFVVFRCRTKDAIEVMDCGRHCGSMRSAHRPERRADRTEMADVLSAYLLTAGLCWAGDWVAPAPGFCVSFVRLRRCSACLAPGPMVRLVPGAESVVCGPLRR